MTEWHHAADLTEGMTDAQREAVESWHAQTVVVAGAGSGKTKVIVQRMLWLMKSGTRADTILAITFTNKAADEMSSRIRGVVGARGTVPTIKTCHGFCVDILRSAPLTIDRTYAFWILDEMDSEEFMRRAAAAVSIPNATTADLRALRANKFVMAEYRHMMRRADAVDFDLIEHGALTILRDPVAGKMWRGYYTDVLVDEYQDTNDAQDEIVRLLGARRTFVVGDIRQSIYGFRGARPAIIRGRMESPDWHMVYLAENFRSEVAIVRTANGVCADEAPMLPMRDGAGVVRYHGGTDINDLVMVALRAGYSPDEIAILGRTWGTVREAAAAVRAAPVQVREKAADLWSTPVARAVLALLTLTQSGHADYMALRVAEHWGDNTDARALRAEADRRRVNVLDIISQTIPMAALVPEWRARYESEFGGLGLWTRDVRAPLLMHDVAERVSSPVERDVVLALAQEDICQSCTVARLLLRIRLRSTADMQAKPGTIQCMTVHAAKGMEWPVVILPDVREGVYPGARSKSEDEREEDRRVLYVAVTRARDALFATYPHTLPPRYGQEAMAAQPSPFMPAVHS